MEILIFIIGLVLLFKIDFIRFKNGFKLFIGEILVRFVFRFKDRFWLIFWFFVDGKSEVLDKNDNGNIFIFCFRMFLLDGSFILFMFLGVLSI